MCKPQTQHCLQEVTQREPTYRPHRSEEEVLETLLPSICAGLVCSQQLTLRVLLPCYDVSRSGGCHPAPPAPQLALSSGCPEDSIVPLHPLQQPPSGRVPTLGLLPSGGGRPTLSKHM